MKLEKKRGRREYTERKFSYEKDFLTLRYFQYCTPHVISLTPVTSLHQGPSYYLLLGDGWDIGNPISHAIIVCWKLFRPLHIKNWKTIRVRDRGEILALANPTSDMHNPATCGIPAGEDVAPWCSFVWTRPWWSGPLFFFQPHRLMDLFWY